MIWPIWLKLATLVVLATAAHPKQSESGLPFDLSESDLAQVDPSAITWITLRTFVGGVEGELRYDRDITHRLSSGECRAVAVIGLIRLRTHYMRGRDEPPVSIRLSLQCGFVYRGAVSYDGIVVQLELRDRVTGELVYRGRERRLPAGG